MNLKKDHLIIALLVIVIGSLAGISIYLMKSNATLQASLTQLKSNSDDRIDTLESQIESLNQQSTNGDFDMNDLMMALNGETSPGPTLMNENDVLENYFVENPTLITPETGPSGQAEISSTNQESESQPIEGPFLKVEPEVFDLGEISKKDGVVNATFQLKNEGDKDLAISYAFTSCGCTIAPLKEEVTLKPGESYPLQVSYDPNFYGTEYELGPIEKTVTILSNYSGNPFYKVKIKADVKP